MASDQILANTGNTMALGRRLGLTGEQMGPIAQLTAGLSTQSGLGPDQIAQLYNSVKIGAADTGVSLDRLVESFQALQKSAGGAQVNTASLVEAQKALSAIAPQANVGQMFASQVGATGMSAMMTAGMLGMTPDAFARIQGDPMALMRANAAMVRNVDPAGSGTAGTLAAEMMLQKAGVDTSMMNPAQLTAFVGKLQRNDWAGAFADQQRIAADMARHRVTAAQYADAAASDTSGQTGIIGQLVATVNNLKQNLTMPVPPGAPVFHSAAQQAAWFAQHGRATPAAGASGGGATFVGTGTLTVDLIDAKTGRYLGTGTGTITAGGAGSTRQPIGHQSFGPSAHRHH